MTENRRGSDEQRRVSAEAVEERERRLIDAVVALAKSLRDERERLAGRLAEVEHELSVLAKKLDAEHFPRVPSPPASSAGRSVSSIA